MSPRETALNALIACRKQEAWINGILKEYIARDKLDRRDAALAARLAYGVLQNRNRLDFYLKQLLTGRVKDLHPAVRDILHLGLYQILELDKIPDSAAVNESVALAKKYCRKLSYAPGLVNAVLRAAVRGKGTLTEPTAPEDRYSHPRALMEALRDSIGSPRLEVMLAADNEIPRTVIQVNTLRTTSGVLTEALERENVTVQPHGWMTDCLVLGNTGSMEELESFRQGLFYVQDPAAKLSVQCAQIPTGTRVLDCCAAPGGKSFAAAIAMAGGGEILSCDVHEHKIGLIRAGARRLGLDNIEATLQDATRENGQWLDKMDVVLADVPCSGYGIIRKKPDIRFKDPASMAELPKLQLAILCNQAKYVRPGGTLLYSTCTLLRRENEDVVKAFLTRRPDYYPEKLELPRPFSENTDGMLTLVPGEYDTDGFFICRLRRKT
ncbi:MAG: 16S rRNA (cytosine(967)-C(5))-methyltransferase RsmB [Firmicutes bacterium]|nr:16S rRNA (cytosine(967)-C(5))-methyltransferase RsmB [Bacillota bacterium]